MKRIILLVMCLAMILVSCTNKPETSPYKGYFKYRYQFYGTFDTVVEIVLYAKTEKEYNYFTRVVESKFKYLHQLYNIFEDTDFNNVKTINDNAGNQPVKVDEALFDLMVYISDWWEYTDQSIDPTLGKVLSVWREYIHNYKDDQENATLPKQQELLDAQKYSGMEYLSINYEDQTVFISKKGVSLDVGAIAKGYAVEVIAEEMQWLGFDSFSISAGGNVKTVGQPMSSEVAKWGVGIHDPKSKDIMDANSDVLDIVFANDMSIVTSGNYQRYYTVDNEKIHHIIDKNTLYPVNIYSSVTVITANSAEGDILSTTLYIIEQEKGMELAQSLGAEVMWVYLDGTIKVTDGIIPLLKKRGGATSSRNTTTN